MHVLIYLLCDVVDDAWSLTARLQNQLEYFVISVHTHVHKTIAYLMLSYLNVFLCRYAQQ